MICQICGRISDSPIECPYCSTNKKKESNDIMVLGDQIFSSQNTKESKESIRPLSIDSDNIESNILNPKTYIMCPSCNTKNPRSFAYCKNCSKPLPIFDFKEERKYRDQKINQVMDLKTREHYFKIGLKLFIAYHLNKIQKEKCGNKISEGIFCNEILTPIDDFCPKCGSPHIFYQCITCGNYIASGEIRCRNCGSPSFISDVMTVINGEAKGEGADIILNELEQIFNITLTKDTFSSVVQQRDIIDSKHKIMVIARETATSFEILSNYLKDFMNPSKKMQLNNSTNILSAKGPEGIKFNTIQRPSITDNMQNVISNIRQMEVQSNPNNSNQSNINPPVTDNNDEHPDINTESPNNNEPHDEDDPWNSVDI